MQKEIAKTDYYTLSVDTAKNRVYLSIIGFWKNLSDVADYLQDIERTTQEVSTGFTVVTDLTQMKIAPSEVATIHEEAQKIVVAAGLDRTAEILPKSVVVKMQLDRFVETSKMKRKVFWNKEDAEAWLDTK